MKTKTYRFGKTTCKAYCKPVGRGFEIGLTFGSSQIFVGNFIHANEANAWWTTMNREVRLFTGRFWVGTSYPVSFYGQFMKAHLYKCYYSTIQRTVRGYTRNFTTEFNKDTRKYRRIKNKKHWGTHDRVVLRAKAA